MFLDDINCYFPFRESILWRNFHVNTDKTTGKFFISKFSDQIIRGKTIRRKPRAAQKCNVILL
jgi:hypothetical protein